MTATRPRWYLKDRATGKLLTHSDFYLDCLDCHDNEPHLCASPEEAFRYLEEYFIAMMELGIEPDIIVVERDLEGHEWQVEHHPEGGWNHIHLGTYWKNGSFP